MRIAMIGQKGLPAQHGGIETHVEELSTRLVRNGHEVIAYTRPWYVSGKARTYNGIRLVRMPSIHTKHLDAISHTFFSLLHACFVLTPDVIHIHGVGPSLLAWMARWLSPSSTVITTFHCIDREHGKWGSFARWMLQIGEKTCARASHATIAVSNTLKTYIEVQYQKVAHYIPNGITPVRTTTNDTLLEPLGLRSYRYIAMVSRLVPHKGAHELIEAWKLAKQMRPALFLDLKLAIVGGSAFTDQYIKQLEAMAADDDSVVLTGYQRGDALKALFAGAKFIVHPSHSEGLPIAVLEAMSYGKAVVGSDIPENMEIIKEHGLSFETGNVQEMAEKIIYLVEHEMEAASIGHASRAYVETEYNWDDIAQETARVYRMMTEQHHGELVTE